MSVAHLLQRHPPAFSSRENAFQFKFGLRFLRLTCVWGTNFQLFCLQSLRPIILNQTIDPIIIGAVNPYQRRPLTWLRRENIFWFKLVLDSSAIRALEGKISRWSVINHPVIAFLHDETFYSVIIGVVHPYQRHLLAWSRWENVFRFYFGLKFLRHPRVWGTNFQLVGLQSLRPGFWKRWKTIYPIIMGVVHPYPRRPWLGHVERMFSESTLVLDSSAVCAFEGQISRWSVFNISVRACVSRLKRMTR